MRMMGTALVALLAALIGGGIGGYAVSRMGGGSGDVRAYLLEHPEVLPEAMQRLGQREAAKAVSAQRGAIEAAFPGAVAGNPQGDVTLVAFMDYNCGYCRASLPALDALVQADPQLRVVYRELPILSPQSRTASEWALAAAAQGKFKPFHAALFAEGRTDDAAIARAAARAGLDVAAARTAAASPAIDAEIARNLEVAGKLGLTGTPSWVVGDAVLSGAQTADALRAAIRDARASR